MNKKELARYALLFYAKKYEWVRNEIEEKITKGNTLNIEMNMECTQEEIKDYLDIIFTTSNKDKMVEIDPIQFVNLYDEASLKIEYLKNYVEMIDEILDKIDGKVKIGHLRSLTHSMEEETNKLDIAINYIFELSRRNKE